MLLLSVLLAAALQVQGDLKLTLDQAVCPTEDSGAVLELCYDIPHSSLAFLKQDTGFRAEFTVSLQAMDRGGNPVAGDCWLRSVSVPDYDMTVAGESALVGVVSLSLPDGVATARVEVADVASARTAHASFPIETSPQGVRIRFLKGGRINPVRSYRVGDTLEVLAEVLDPVVGVDSFRFLVTGSGRPLAIGGLVPGFDSAGRRMGRFRAALGDSSGAPRTGAGEHWLEVTGLSPEGSGARGRASFRIEVPFFLDDAAYRQKVDRLLYVASIGEMDELRRLVPPEREAGWHALWSDKDPTPTTERNEKEEEYFERIEYAEEHFGHGDRGYRSDRARVYVELGPPGNIDSRPFEIDSRAYEVWSYYSLGREFLFVDRSGFGEYVLEDPRSWNEP